MDDLNTAQPLREPLEDLRERSLVDDLRQLAADGRVLAKAEAEFQKARAAYAGQQAGSIAALGAVGAILALVALIALAVGFIIALTPLITAWGATAAVVVVLLALAAGCAATAARRWRRTKAVLSESGASQ